MSELLRASFTPATPEEFRPYVFNEANPPLDPNKLKLDLLAGGERDRLHTVVTGDVSLVITYKKREGVLASVSLPDDELSVLQLQGSKQQEGYRVSTGMKWIHFFADRLWLAAIDPRNAVKRITMPSFGAIDGYNDGKGERFKKRYDEFTQHIGLVFSNEERIWVRDVRR